MSYADELKLRRDLIESDPDYRFVSLLIDWSRRTPDVTDLLEPSEVADGDDDEVHAPQPMLTREAATDMPELAFSSDCETDLE